MKCWQCRYWSVEPSRRPRKPNDPVAPLHGAPCRLAGLKADQGLYWSRQHTYAESGCPEGRPLSVRQRAALIWVEVRELWRWLTAPPLQR